MSGYFRAGGFPLWLLPLLMAGLVSGCRPAPGRPYGQTVAPPPAAWSAPRPAPVIAQRPQVVAGNPWKPTVAPRAWRYIVVHHTASTKDSIESIDAAHKARKWDGIGYHFVIGNGNGMTDGLIEPTFRWKTQMHGAHAKTEDNEYNDHGIGVCLVGNFELNPPSVAQLASVKRLIAVLKSEYKIGSSNVVGHRDVKATACPGKLFPLADVGQSELLPVFVQNTGEVQYHVASPTLSESSDAVMAQSTEAVAPLLFETTTDETEPSTGPVVVSGLPARPAVAAERSLLR